MDYLSPVDVDRCKSLCDFLFNLCFRYASIVPNNYELSLYYVAQLPNIIQKMGVLKLLLELTKMKGYMNK